MSSLAVMRCELARLWRSPFTFVLLSVAAVALGFVPLWQLESYLSLQDELRRSPGAPDFHAIVIAGSAEAAFAVLVALFPLAAVKAYSDRREPGTLLLWQAAPLGDRAIVLGLALAHGVLALVLAGLFALPLLLLLPHYPLDGAQLLCATGAVFGAALTLLALAQAAGALARHGAGALLLSYGLCALVAVGPGLGLPLGGLSLGARLAETVRGLPSLAALAYVLLTVGAGLGVAYGALRAERRAP